MRVQSWRLLMKFCRAVVLLQRFVVGFGLFSASPFLFGQTVFLNEIMSANSRTILDENGDSSDWIELFNASAAPVNLAGWGLSDDAALPFKWTFRDTSLAPGGFLLVFASGKDRQPGSVNRSEGRRVGKECRVRWATAP